MQSKFLAGGLLVSALLLSGCANRFEQILNLEQTRSPSKALEFCLDQVKESLDAADKLEEKKLEGADVGKKKANAKKVIIKVREDRRSATNEFLNCVFVEDVKLKNLELRLLRGHAVVGLLAIYGEYLIDKPTEKREDDADRLLGRIFLAENKLWNASACKAKSEDTANNGVDASTIQCKSDVPAGYVLKHRVDHVERVFTVTQVALAASKPVALVGPY